MLGMVKRRPKMTAKRKKKIWKVSHWRYHPLTGPGAEYLLLCEKKMQFLNRTVRGHPAFSVCATRKGWIAPFFRRTASKLPARSEWTSNGRGGVTSLWPSQHLHWRKTSASASRQVRHTCDAAGIVQDSFPAWKILGVMTELHQRIGTRVRGL
jgi:hypothetical protein